MASAFSGEPAAVWLTEPGTPDRNMKLTTAFWYRDPKGRQWDAPNGMLTDGASIPRALWTLVGSPFTGDYRRAALVHDHACREAEGDRGKRRAADRMFYHACRTGGCSVRDATILYVGVRIGSLRGFVPAWESAAEGLRPKLARSGGDLALERDFQAAADEVLADGEIDDVEVIERRTDEALSMKTGVALVGM